jgi:2-furoyl-CoA dehydrogenase FAD binding subunit
MVHASCGNVSEARVKPAPFDYVRPESLRDVHAMLASEGTDARILAGGQSLLPMLSMRLTRPKLVIDIMRLAGIADIRIDGNDIRVGCGVRQAQLLSWPDLQKHQPLLAAALPWVGHAQTRSRGTVCGSIAQADPSAELPLVLVAIGGSVELSSKRKRRTASATEFFTGAMSTARGDDELIEALRFPALQPGAGTCFREFGRRHGDFAIVACAAIADGQGARLAIGGVADRPTMRDFGALEGKALEEALNVLAWELEARDDLHATARYRRDLVRRMGRETIEEARRCRA